MAQLDPEDHRLVRRVVTSRLAILAPAFLALGLGGCGMSDTLRSDAGWFSKPLTGLLSQEDGSGSQVSRKDLTLGPAGSVPPEDLVNADGSCALAAAETPANAPPQNPDRAVGSVAGDLAGAAAPQQPPPALGGIALTMTECQVVRRAGIPSNVAIGVAESNERQVVLTYAGGEWPGIYTFVSGRLKVVDAVPMPDKPKPVAKKKKPVPKRAPTRID